MTILLRSSFKKSQNLNQTKNKNCDPWLTNRELAVEASRKQWRNQASAVATVPAAVAMLSVFDCDLGAPFSSVVRLK